MIDKVSPTGEVCTCAQVPYQILGLDIGIGSCGWAILDTANARIVDMGVRLWEVPQEPKTKVSTATTRRNRRSARRNNQREKDRKKHCITLLREHSVIPADADASWLQTQPGDKPTLQLRVNGLDRRLTQREWGQVLYSFCSRRGYIPHGEGSDDDEGKKVLGAIKEQGKRLEAAGYRTIGELLYHQERSRNRGGDYSNCVSNAQISDELSHLFSAQRNYGNECADAEFETLYLGMLSWQKDVSSHDEAVYRRVGCCTYFPSEKRAARACLSSELCNAYEKVGHITIVEPSGASRPLPVDIRLKTIGILFSIEAIRGNKDCKVRYSDLREWLDLHSDAIFKGIEREAENKTEVYVPKCWRSQRKVLPKGLCEKMRGNLEFADAIDSALTYASSKPSLMEQLDGLNLGEEEKEALASLSYSSKAYSGYASRSLKAISMLVDAFEDPGVVTLADAERACGLEGLRLDKPKDKGFELPPYLLYDPTCTNPVVMRVMGQVRKIVNAVIRTYGMPDEIHIELARELKHSKAEKNKITKSNNERKRSREALRAKLAEELRCDEASVPLKIIEKVELYNEQHGFDIYTGGPIKYDRLIHDSTYCEIDHILPYSRTCDDSRMNKALVLKESNQEKRQQTPYEWLREDGRWEEFRLRITRLERYPRAKKDKLLNTSLDESESEFIARNLNDARYASRAAMGYLDQYLAFPENGRLRHVVAVAGGATSALRNAWGVRKARADDNLHHAVDAAIIAACSEGSVRAIALASEKKSFTPKERRAELFQATEPWVGFASEIIARKDAIIPTFMTMHKISGSAFEETAYRFFGYNEEGTKGLLAKRDSTAAGGYSLKASSNYVTQSNGTAHIVDELAFVRLWWDPTAEVRGRKDKPGKYLAEPVYCADIPSIMRGDYVVRLIPPQTSKRPREKWDALPAELADQSPIVVFRNDMLNINGTLRRFAGIDINANSWNLADPQGKIANNEATKGLAMSVVDPENRFILVDEDVLGLCYKGALEY